MRKNNFCSIVAGISVSIASLSVPLYPNLFEKHFPSKISPIEFYVELEKTYQLFLSQLYDQKQWIQENNLEEKEITPYVQALVVPTGSRLIVIGDLHGDLNSLQSVFRDLYNNIREYVNKKLVLKKDCYLIFTGDYHDRGENGIAVWQTLFTLKQKNPDRVFLLRGNHETHDMAHAYGFWNEIKQRSRTWQSSPTMAPLIWDSINDLFNCLPHALFVETAAKNPKTIMFCHGGIGGYVRSSGKEVIFDPSDIMKRVRIRNRMKLVQKRRKKGGEKRGQKRRSESSQKKSSQATWLFQKLGPSQGEKNYLEKILSPLSSKTLNYPIHNWFLWNDFITPLVGEKEGSYISPRFDGARLHSYNFAKKYLEKHDLHAVIRGHQHIPGGIVQLRKNISPEDEDLQTLLNPDFIDSETLEMIGKLYSWLPLSKGKRSEIEEFSVFTCTTSPIVFDDGGKSAYAIIESAQDSNGNNAWYITPHYNSTPSN